MLRPLKHFAYKLGRDLHLDIDVIMSWPLDKLYEYMAFYITESTEWQEKYKQESISPEQQQNAILHFLRGSV